MGGQIIHGRVVRQQQASRKHGTMESRVAHVHVVNLHGGKRGSRRLRYSVDEFVWKAPVTTDAQAPRRLIPCDALLFCYWDIPGQGAIGAARRKMTSLATA
jgi:hypothetical protein